MTAADVDPVRAFRDALPQHLARFAMTDRIVALVHGAVRDHGWTPRQLAAECARSSASRINPGGHITRRLEAVAGGPPPEGVSKVSARRVHDGCCENGWIYDESGDTVRTTKCPGKTQEVPA